jgi:M6 family metalloprotease-like protein
MKYHGSRLLFKCFSVLIVFLLVVSILSVSIIVYAPNVDQVYQSSNVPINVGPELFEDNYIVELIQPRDASVDTTWYVEMQQKIQAYNTEMGWGNAGPAWYYEPIPSYSSSRGPSPLPLTVGTEEVVVIAANFSDSPTGSTPNHNPDTKTATWFNATSLFKEDPSNATMHNYFDEVSYGAINITGEIAENSSNSNGWYTSKYTRAQADSNTRNFVSDAVSLANPDIDYSKYDNDANGRIDHLLIIHAGNDQASSGSPPDIWSHRSWWWPPITAGDGITFNTYAIVAENDPMGIFAHEFGHDLGLPDLYNTTSGNAVVGKWALMDTGSWNLNSTGVSRPAHLSAWSKADMGWIQPIVINETNNNQGVVQVNQTTSPTNDSVVYRVDIKGDNEYYLIENRNDTEGTFDEALPNRGILIWHIDDDMTINRGIPPTMNYYAILLEDYQNDLNEENYNATKNAACWKSSGTADQADFNTTTAPNSSANGGTPSGIYIDRIKDNALWNMTVRILVSDDTDPPGAPKNVQAFDAENDNGEIVNITWDASPDDGANDSDVTNYNIYMNDTGGVSQPKIFIKSVNAIGVLSYGTQIIDLVDGVLYNFTVLADDGPNASPYPGNFTAMPLDNIVRKPTGANAVDTNPDDGENITLTWALSEDDPIGNASGPADILWYNVSINDTGQGAGGSKHILVTLGPGNSSFQVENLTNNVPYYFIITAVDDAFNIGNTSEVSAIPTDDLVGSPINLQVNPSIWTNVSNFILQWTNPVDNAGIDNAYYKLDTAPTDNNDFTGNDSWPGVNTLTVTDSLSDGSHRVYVWLRDGELNRDYTTAVYTNLLYDGTPPASPSGLATLPSGWSGTNSFRITWNNPVEVSGISGVYYSIDSKPRYFNDGIYIIGNNINQLNNIMVPTEGVHTIYIWLRDNANNMDYTTNVSITLYLDVTSPGKPLDLQATPSSWTSVNSFDLSWTNPADLSGIIGARYKVDLFPTFDTDGIYVPGVNINSIQNVRVGYSASHTVYVWLVDNASNINFMNWNTTILRFDINPPAQPLILDTVPSYWTNINSFMINWTNQWDHSGIAGVYYKLDSAPTAPNDGVYVAGADIEQLTGITVIGNGTHGFYFWLRDIAGNTNHLNYSFTQLFYDALAPAPPVDITPYPTNVWTNNNSFAVAWDLPFEHSGIAGAYYKLDSEPTANDDGIYIDKLQITYIQYLTVTGSGSHPIYVWLVDRMGNVNYLNYSVTQFLFDDTPPSAPVNIKITPNGWTDTNNFNITWTNPPDDSGIYGLYYWFSAPTENLGKLVIGPEVSSLSNLTIPGQGLYTIYIWLIDNAYNMDYTNNGTGQLHYDLSPPNIIHSRITYATEGLPITLNAMVSDPFSGVNEVKLFYKHDSDESYVEQVMQFKGSVYMGEIPGDFVTNETLGYYIYASDNTDKPKILYYGKNGQTSYLPGATTDIDITITEEDVFPPTIIHQKVLTGTLGIKIAMTAIVNDDGSGVAAVRVFYRSKGTSAFQVGNMANGDPYYFELPEYVVTTQGIEYYLYAMDNSPRQNEVYYGRDGPTSVDPATDGRFIFITVSSVDDAAPEIIYGPEVTQITPTSGIVVWITNEPADTVIDYGTDTNLTTHGFNTSFITFHSLLLTDLTPDTIYYYQVSATDRIDNGPTMSNILSFRTTKIGEEDSDGDGTPDNVDTDDDNDNIPDVWEELHGLNPKDSADADYDTDNDGYSNYREYLDDTDPLDPDSTPVSTTDDTPPILNHEPITKVEIYHSVTFSATAVDEDSGVRAVILHYKLKSESEYTPINMTPNEESRYSYVLQGSKVSGDIEYYMEALDNAFNSNRKYFGTDGQMMERPTSANDLDIRVIDRTGDPDDDDDSIFGDLGKPFGINNDAVCLIVIIILIVLLLCFLFAIKSAFSARALSQQAMRYKSTTSDGEPLVWEGDAIEELDEVDDLEATGDKKKTEDDLDSL